MKLTPSEWLEKIDFLINKAVTSDLDRWWDEDIITYKILKSFTKKLKKVTITSPAPQNVAWDLYKFAGKNFETKYGDIAILVKFTFPNGTEKEGVAFLEAKRFYTQYSRFKALDFEQLQLQLDNTHAHRTLLYVGSASSRHATNLELQYCSTFQQDALSEGHALTVPSETTISLHDKKLTLLDHSLPLSYILTTRYLKGMELDYNPDTVRRTKGFMNDKSGVKFLLVTHITYDLTLEPEPGKIKIGRQYKLVSLVPDDPMPAN
ncbi:MULTISPECIES: hypothetical protein [Pseudomonas]|jgi:hypothetical protein|uniref:hypothetical protein n=1 Tax=Pseudomonas TaxID=286 RepID=UPI0008129C9B|nr:MULTISPECIES: hypothetical protein [Pseudomonas]RZI28676.1 hypothetical protein EUX53_02880 [Pseudomonas orientalis]CRM37678.1 hypothetical protein [Pseudomonas sp. 28 E 9]